MLTSDFWLALGAIVVIDLVLAGDNALVIAMAARRLNPTMQRRAIYIGTALAVAIRALATIGIVFLLKIPLLMAAGGLFLIVIGYRLLVERRARSGAKDTGDIWSAVRTIALADTIMSLDNVLAVAGAARHDVLLVVLGLLISIPIMVFGSTLILRLIERFPFLLAVGAWVIEWTAFGMIADDPLLSRFFDDSVVHAAWTILLPLIVVAYGWWKRPKTAAVSTSAERR
ncbi:MAG: TerC family protein [Hydrogenibacillus sp.]|nr:TerC family protein [Hydrogenibacillus sp.]